MRLLERQTTIRSNNGDFGLIESGILDALDESDTPVRFVVTASNASEWLVELGVLQGEPGYPLAPLFRFRQRSFEAHGGFNVVLVVPTGIGAEIGGHAGDASPVAIAMAQVADTLITHPNVVNASDINELPSNGLYVEGSVLSRLLMGTVGLRPMRSNRVLVALDSSYSERYAAYTVNAVNAARSTYGLNCAGIVRIEPALRLSGGYTSTGRASGTVDGLAGVIELLQRERDSYDAVALASVIDVPAHYHFDYFTSGGEMVNPWGGVEALLTHAVSAVMDVPTAHAPMMESDDIASVDPGIVDSRMAAEVISITFFQSVLKGLQRAPQVVTEPAHFDRADVLTAEDVSCVVIPDGCIGLPTLAALRQGIPVIAVGENRNLMENDLTALPWRPGQLYTVDNYWEATGVAAALKAGIDPVSVRRPIATLRM